MKKSILSVASILVYTLYMGINEATMVESALAKLRNECEKVEPNRLSYIENSGKYKKLGEGSFGKVFEISPEQVVKIITLKRKDKRTDEKFAKEINGLMLEIEFMKFYDNNKKKGFKGLDLDPTYNSKIFYMLSFFGCQYLIKNDDNGVAEIKVALTLEKLDLNFDKYMKKKKDLNVIHLLEIIKKIIRGLYQMHQYGYAHLDLKPDNIMMKNPFEPVLIDFGLVLPIVKTETQLSIVDIKQAILPRNSYRGTPLYMDPNIFNGSYSFYNDVYSLGVMIYEFFDIKNPLGSEYNSKTREYNRPIDNLVFPEIPKSAKEYPFQHKDFHRAKYFRSLIYWLTRRDITNRLYLDFAIEKIREIEQNFYKDCKLGITISPDGRCFKGRKEYEKYRKGEYARFIRSMKKNKPMKKKKPMKII